MKTKENLKDLINYIDDEQADFLYRLINTFSNPYLSKGDIMKLVFNDTSGIDSALPCDYVKRIQEVLPSFKTQFHVMNYQENTYGEINNVCELLILRIQAKLNN